MVQLLDVASERSTGILQVLSVTNGRSPKGFSSFLSANEVVVEWVHPNVPCLGACGGLEVGMSRTKP